jgi:hypothetical protein
MGRVAVLKTTKQDFLAFKTECEKWIGIFGLLGWKFYFQHKDDKELDGNTIAYCVFPQDAEDRYLTIGLSVNIDTPVPVTRYDILRSAFHEVMEGLLYKIQDLAKDRYVKPAEIREEIHNLIRILEEVIFERRNKR